MACGGAVPPLTDARLVRLGTSDAFSPAPSVEEIDARLLFFIESLAKSLGP
jgi:hypothetical protein